MNRQRRQLPPLERLFSITIGSTFAVGMLLTFILPYDSNAFDRWFRWACYSSAFFFSVFAAAVLYYVRRKSENDPTIVDQLWSEWLAIVILCLFVFAGFFLVSFSSIMYINALGVERRIETCDLFVWGNEVIRDRHGGLHYFLFVEKGEWDVGDRYAVPKAIYDASPVNQSYIRLTFYDGRLGLPVVLGIEDLPE